MAQFILYFEFLVMPVSIVTVVNSFELIKHYGAQTFTLFVLVSLVVNSILLKKLGYLMDVYSKKKVVQVLSTVMIILMGIIVLTNTPWIHVIFFSCCFLFFNIFYSVYNATSQSLQFANKRHISASMEMTGKITNLISSLFIWAFFEILGTQAVFALSFIILLSAIIVFRKLPDHEIKITKKETTHSIENKSYGFQWFLAQPIAWLVSLTIICNLMVLQSNTINSVYIYQVLNETPETLSLISAAFSAGSLIGSLGSFWLTNEKNVIYLSFILSSVASIFLAIHPNVNIFIISMTIFGMSNSATRVTSRSLIMKTIPNIQSGTFYALRASISSGIQFISLGIMTIIVGHLSPSAVVWFFPILILVAPLLWFVRYYALKK